MPGARCIETDYLPDTSNDACKRANILLRFRQVEGVGPSVLLLTLKIRQADNGVLHFREYETNLNTPNLKIIAIINDLLQAYTGLILSGTVLRAKTLKQVKAAIHTVGFTRHRILLSKYRENFILGDDNATIDYFPDDMGVYIEFESHTMEALRNRIKQVGFSLAAGTDTDYGDLLKLHKAGLQDQAQRTALFSASEIKILHGLMKESHGN